MLSEPARMGLLEYFGLLHEAIEGQVQVLSARYSEERAAVRWTYRARVGIADATFLETISMRGPYAIRVGFWTATPYFEKFAPEFRELSESFLFKEGDEWVAHWKEVDFSLPECELGWVEIAEPEAEQPAVECAVPDQHLLWEISGQNGTVHLFGSLHLGRNSFYPLAEPIESAFEESDRLVVEVDMRSAEAARTLADVMANAKLPEGQSLQDVVSEHVYRKLVATVGEMGLPMTPFESLEPWLVAMTLSTLKMQSLGYLPDAGVEAYFLGKVGNREILELESAAQQFALFESLDSDLFLAYTVLSLNTLEDVAERMITAWRCGDTGGLERILLSDYQLRLPGSDELLESIFFARNRAMADSIEELLLEEGRFFVVVGAAHLVGEKGLVSVLRERGWEVVRR
jgi:uncharacterized protein YbaP (TraB family)